MGAAPPFRHRPSGPAPPSPAGKEKLLCPPGGGPPEPSEGEEGEHRNPQLGVYLQIQHKSCL